jgi:molybdenum cofactor guanylyltransferase
LKWEKDNKSRPYFLDAIALQKTAVILAGGFSRRFGSDKGLVLLMGKPLVRHVIDKASPAVDEVLVVVSSEEQKKNFESIVGNEVKVIIDKDDSQTPLVGAITGFENSKGEYSLLLPCDAPLISTPIVQFLLDMCTNRHAAIPRWPNGYIEPLQAVYHTKSALTAAKTALKQGHMNMRSMIENMTKVRYVSTIALEQLEPELVTFFNVNTPQDLKKAESFLK